MKGEESQETDQQQQRAKRLERRSPVRSGEPGRESLGERSQTDPGNTAKLKLLLFRDARRGAWGSLCRGISLAWRCGVAIGCVRALAGKRPGRQGCVFALRCEWRGPGSGHPLSSCTGCLHPIWVPGTVLFGTNPTAVKPLCPNPGCWRLSTFHLAAAQHHRRGQNGQTPCGNIANPRARTPQTCHRGSISLDTRDSRSRLLEK